MRRISITSILALILTVLVYPVAAAAPVEDLMRVNLGTSTELNESQKEELESFWTDKVAPGKFICSGLHLEGASFDDRVASRKQAKETCNYLSQSFDLENWYQAKPTSAASLVGAVYVRLKRDEPQEAASEDSSSTASASVSPTVSQTTSLPEADYSTSSLSEEVLRAGLEKAAEFESPSEIVCTSVVGESAESAERARAMEKASRLCEEIASKTGSKVRHQVKVSKTSWAGRMMLTSIWSSKAEEKSTEEKQIDVPGDSATAESDPISPPNPPSRPISQPPSPPDSSPAPAESDEPVTPEEEETEPSPTEEQPPAPTPDFSKSGLDFFGSVLLGSQLRLADSNAEEGETVRCRWYRDNRLGGTYGTECAITISIDMFSRNLYLEAVFAGSAGERRVTADFGVIDYAEFEETINFSLGGDIYRNSEGDITWGSTPTVVASPLPSGARLTCIWYRGTDVVTSPRLSNDCSLPINLDSSFLGHWVEARAQVSKQGYRTVTSRLTIKRPSGARDLLSPPEFSIAGDIFRNSDGDITWGSTVTVSTGSIDDGARLSCLWFTGRNWVTGTRWSTECSLPISLDSPFLGNYVEVRAEVSKPGYRSSTTILNIGRPSDWRDFILAPETSISGRYAVGSSLQIEVGPVDDGAQISCLWYTGDSYPYAARAERWSTDCTLLVTSESGFLGQYLRARVVISKTGYATIIRSLVAGRLQQ